MADPTVIPRVGIAQAFLTKAPAGTMGKHQVGEIAEAGEGKTSKEGEQGADGREGMEEVAGGATKRVR